MGIGRTWTKQEEEYLSDKWGTVSVGSLAQKLNRSETAIIIRKERLKLGSFLESGDYVTFHQLLLAIGMTGGDGYKNISWIKNKGFPVKYRRVKNNRFKVVYLDEFWKWAEANQRMLDFTKFEKNSLGMEPDWVDAKRRLDFSHKSKYIATPWTPLEDAELIRLVKEHKYTYKEISQKIRRTEGAVQRRICDLGVKDRPIKANNHVNWTDEEISLLTTMIKAGCKYETITEHLHRGVKAIRGYVFRMYLTENLDKVRELMGAGDFGCNRPVRTIANRYVMNTEERAEFKQVLSRFMYILQILPESSLFEAKRHFEDNDYWQRDLCMNWDPSHGCTEAQADCDSCAYFRRKK